MKFKLKTYFLFSLFLFIVIFGIVFSFVLKSKSKEVSYSSTVVLSSDEKVNESVVYIKDVVLGKFNEISEVYLNEVGFSFNYNYEDNPDFLNNMGSGWKYNQMDKLVGRGYEIDLQMKVKMGLNLKSLIVSENDNLLYIEVPEDSFKYLFIPDFSESHFELNRGFFRKNFTEEDRRLLYEDAINIGEKYAEDNIITSWDKEKNINTFLYDLLNDILQEDKKLLIEIERGNEDEDV